MAVLTLGTVAFDTIETPFGNSGKVVGGAASYIALAVSHFVRKQHLVSVIGEDFPRISFSTSGRGACLDGLTRVEGGRAFIGQANTTTTWWAATRWPQTSMC